MSTRPAIVAVLLVVMVLVFSRHAGAQTIHQELTGAGSIILDRPGRITLALTERGAAGLPREFALHQNYPNPFNGTTIIRYDLPAATQVRLQVYSILGQLIATLVDDAQKAGFLSVRWDAQGIATGTYFCRLKAGDYGDTRKLLILR